MPVLHGVREERRIDVYDSFSPGHELTQVRTRLLSSIQGGPYSNYAIAGCLSRDQTVMIDHFYARTDLDVFADDRVRRAFHDWAHTTEVMFGMGEMPQRRWPMWSLLQEKPWVPPSRRGKRMTDDELAQLSKQREEGVRMVIVPVRQNVWFEVTSSPDALGALRAAVGGRRSPLVWCHIEGIERRDVP